MHVSVSAAKAQLDDLVCRAAAGDDVVLTRDGQPDVRLVVVPAKRKRTAEEKRAALAKFVGILKDRPGFEGVTSQNITDFLYGEDGLPA